MYKGIIDRNLLLIKNFEEYFMKEYEDNIEYINLVAEWNIHKQAEKQANAKRLQVEEKILQIVKPSLKESGTNNLPQNLKIITGLAATVNKEAVNELYKKFINNELDVQEFPFSHQWAANLISLESIRLSKPSLFKQLFASVFSVKPKKPSFEVKI